MSPRFAPRFVIALIAGLALAACGDSEATQRKTFSDFLQSRILDKPGLHVPKPSDDEMRSFGPYAKDYGIITAFHEGMDTKVSGPLKDALQKGMIRSLDDLTQRRGDLAAAVEGFRILRTALDEELAKADAAHATLTEPADLKFVFDKAYDRTITVPAKAFKEVFPPVDAAFKAAQALADYLEQHKAAIKINGGLVQSSDPKLVAEINRLIGDLTSNAQAIAEAQRKLVTLLQDA